MVLPGGFGTMDKLFEALTLVATGKITKFPIVLVGRSYWSGLLAWLQDTMLTQANIGHAEFGLISVVDEPGRGGRDHPQGARRADPRRLSPARDPVRADRCDIARRAWHDKYVPVLMVLVVIVILVGVFFVATGRGGELAYEQADHAPLDLGPVSATDVALLRPPTALWGYNMQVTDEALERIAQAVRDRDVTIAFLQQRLADLTAPAAPILPPGGPSGPEHPADPPRPRRSPADPSR